MKLRLAKPAREAIGVRLREFRRFHSLEQMELAQMAGLSQAIISQYEKGMTEISLSFIAFLSDKFGVSTEWLISGKPIPLFSNGEDVKARGEKKTLQGSKLKRTARFIQIPLVSPAVAARPGAVRDDTIQEWQPVPGASLSGRKNLVAVDVKAPWVKNMGPAFRPTSRVIIDREDKLIQGNRYYAVNEKAADSLSITGIRRLNLSDSRLWFLEDYPSSGSFSYIDLGPRLPLERAVVGRLVWICQPL
jgi:transcriptional regulator with XRE-family HTH domain